MVNGKTVFAAAKVVDAVSRLVSLPLTPPHAPVGIMRAVSGSSSGGPGICSNSWYTNSSLAKVN